jgi:ComF family protein
MVGPGRALRLGRPPPAGNHAVSAAFALATRLVLDPVLAVVFPASCPVCFGDVAHPTRGPLCEPCWAALPRHAGPLCGCGFPLPARIFRCGRCRRGLNPVTAGASLGPFEGSLRTAIHELKYRGRRRVAGRLAEEILALPDAATLLSPGAILVPVPLHPRRLRERGFNQAELLAREIGRRSGLVAISALRRKRETAPQTGLSAAIRRANVSGAFVVERRGVLAGRVVVLVDDVYTTGATALACARVMRAAGALEVRVLTLARVP